MSRTENYLWDKLTPKGQEQARLLAIAFLSMGASSADERRQVAEAMKVPFVLDVYMAALKLYEDARREAGT